MYDRYIGGMFGYNPWKKKKIVPEVFGNKNIEYSFNYKNKKLNMAKKTYLSPGIMLLQTGGGPGAGGDLPYASTPHDDELAKPGQFEDFDDDDEAYRTLW